jgi:hypothetical protein
MTKPARKVPNEAFNKYGLETWTKHEWQDWCPMRCKHCGVPIGVGPDNFCVRYPSKKTTGLEPAKEESV